MMNNAERGKREEGACGFLVTAVTDPGGKLMSTPAFFVFFVYLIPALSSPLATRMMFLAMMRVLRNP